MKTKQHLRRGRRSEPAQTNYWQSYSDMMASLLMVFILIVAISIVSLNQYRARLAEQNEELLARQELLEKQNEEFLKLKVELEAKQGEIDRIIGIKQEIIEALNEEFGKQDITIDIDQQTGAIVFDSSILYDRSAYKLKSDGRKFLDRFLPIYIGVLFGDDFREDIAEIIIEGHTDSSGSYESNLKLSQERALQVALYCLNMPSLTSAQKQKLQQILTAKGRSYADLIYDENGVEDAEASRRVEFKFSLRDSDMIEEMKRILEENDLDDAAAQSTAPAGAAGENGAPEQPDVPEGDRT